uniref:Uncharacterized protein n=1 Tax=Vitis vinifera TaxID=29760 RepID=F6I1K3_VITVI
MEAHEDIELIVGLLGKDHMHMGLEEYYDSLPYLPNK